MSSAPKPSAPKPSRRKRDEQPQDRRRLGRSRRRTRGGEQGPAQLPFRQPVNRIPPVEILDGEQVEDIHLRSLAFLESDGIEVLSARARSILGKAGALVDDDRRRVTFDHGLIEELVGRAPRGFRLQARNPARALDVGGRAMLFTAVASAPNASDLADGRRPGSLRDFRDLLRLSQSLNSVHALGGYPVEPTDLPPATRHLDCVADFIRLTDKAYRLYALGAERIRDGLEMTRIANGLTEDGLQSGCHAFTNINVNSPLRLDGPMAEGLIEMSARNQAVIVTPFTLAGAMAPVSLAGALLQQNVEALAVIALTQAVRPGAPVVYGCFTSNVDMKSGAPAFGTPEYLRAAQAGGQLARRYGLPYRSSNANAANAVDAQAAYESLFSLMGAAQGGANIVQHALGWLEGGLTASFEKMVLDAELLQCLTASQEPIDTAEAEYGLEAIREVGPGGHFFGSAHTMERYENAFYAPMLSDWRNFEAWRDAGAPDAATRAAGIARDLLRAYEPPPLDSAVSEELDAFVARRKEEGGVADA